MRFRPSCEQTLRALARYPVAHGVQLAGRIDHLSGRDRPDRPHPGRVHAARLCSPAPASPSSPPTAPTPGAPASPRNCRGLRSPGCIRWVRSTTSCFSSRIPKRRCWWSTASTFRDRGGELAARATGLKTVFTLGPADYGVDLLQAIEAAGSATRALLRRPRRYRDAELHRRHDRQIQGRAAPSPRIWRLRQRDPRRFRNSGHAALSHGGADQPCRRHQGAADADARRHRAHAEGFRSRGGVQDHRARAHQFHAVRADHDLRDARSSRARQDRPLLARTAAVWRVRDVAEPAGRGHRADRAGVLAALRPDRMLSGVGAAQGGPRSQDAGAVLVLRLPDRRLRGQDSRRRRPGSRDRRGRRDLRARRRM